MEFVKTQKKWGAWSKNSWQEYCDRPECQKARNANNQREFRRRKAIEKAQGKSGNG